MHVNRERCMSTGGESILYIVSCIYMYIYLPAECMFYTSRLSRTILYDIICDEALLPWLLEKHSAIERDMPLGHLYFCNNKDWVRHNSAMDLDLQHYLASELITVFGGGEERWGGGRRRGKKLEWGYKLRWEPKKEEQKKRSQIPKRFHEKQRL